MLCCLFPFIASSQEVTLLFAGDAMLHQSQINGVYKDGKYDFSDYFAYIKDEVEAADLSIVNLETPLAGKPYQGYPRFSGPNEYALSLKEAGFDVLLLANNHILDQGNKGLIRTLTTLDSIDVYHTGVFRDKKERENVYPLFVEEKGIRFALLNYTYGTNGFVPQSPVCVNYIDTAIIRKDIEKAKLGNADIIIANMHWGEEYKLIQNKTQENLAQFLVNEGVDLIIGAHPHVIQPSKAILDSEGNIDYIIVYSLGNLISGMLAENTDGGQLIKITLEKDPDGKVNIKSAGHMLVYRHKESRNGKLFYQVIPVSRAEDVLYPIVEEDQIPLSEDALKKMSVFTKNARAIFNQYNEGIPEYRFQKKEKQVEEEAKNTSLFFGN